MSAVFTSDMFSFNEADDSVSPTTALFPPSLSFPGLEPPDQTQYLSSRSSLSPRSSENIRPSLSPPSSASPSSSFSFATDEYLLSNTFGTDELDLLIFPEDSTVGGVDQSLPLLFQSQPSGFPSVSNIDSSIFDVKPVMETAPPIPTATMEAIQPPPAFDGLLHQWRLDLGQNPSAPWGIPTAQVPSIPQSEPWQGEASPSHLPAPRRSAPNAPLNKPTSSPPINVGKHNKTERRYRQKVQQAQADLRDAIPALRVLYGTSTDEQKLATDFRAIDGTVDGLGEVTRPNASAKATILIGARMYIEVLQRRCATLHRKVAELENWRLAVGGAEDLNSWRMDFDAREALLAAQLTSISNDDVSDFESDDVDEDEGGKRKRPRVTAKKAKASSETKMGNTLRAFAAFAVSFSLLPSASTFFKVQTESSTGNIMYMGDLPRHRILAQLPIITAEHTSRLLARALPSPIVPNPHTLVDWTVRLLTTFVLILIFGPLVERLSKFYQDKKTGAGNLLNIFYDITRLAFGVPAEAMMEWNALAAGIVGGAIHPSPLIRWHVGIRLRRSTEDPYSLALSALLNPRKRISRLAWVKARSHAETESSLAAVLALPLDEAARSLEFVPSTAAPIASIAEQVSLIHLYDLYARFFVQLVDAIGEATSLSAMFANVRNSDIPLQLKSFDKEIRGVLHGVPRHSSSHALGIVLLGLWGLFSGYASPALLVSALAEEEVQGAGASLSSVSAMLDLLYPGCSTSQVSIKPSVPINALSIDKLALVCIGFVDLLFSSSQLNAAVSRLERLEASQRVQKETSRLRLMLTQATFVGLDDADEESDADEGAFGDARQQLVAVLCNVGRRAAGRAIGRDEDSGLEDELDEL